ncbi:MAG: hybrid sensor histidine kinase/response regulator [Micavibrio sp.]|nr:hybrid sensor histidine kinase/response regulator [Micavibrio sp.]
MSLDHRPFIQKYTSTSVDPSQARSPLLVLTLVIMCLLVISIVCGMAYDYLLGMDFTKFIGIPIIFVGLLASLFVCKTLSIYSPREKYFRILNEVIEGSRGARLVTDASNRTIHTNYNFDAFCKGFGKPSFQTMLAVFERNPEAAAHIHSIAEDARRGMSVSMDIPIEAKGSTFIYAVSAQPVPGWAGYIHWRLDDITEQYLKDQSIEEEREKLIDFTDNAPVGFFSCDENGRFVFVNATFARWLGTNIENLIGSGQLHSYMMTPPRDEDPYDIIPGGGARQVAEIKLKGPRGADFLVSINQTVVQYDDGAVRTRAVVSDIRAEREMERALQESRNRFRRFFEEAPLSICLLSEKNAVNDSNQALSTILDVDSKDLRHKDFLNFVDKPDRHAFKGALERIVSGDDLEKPLELNLVKLDGAQVPVRVYAHKLRGGAEIVLHFLNLTKERALEEQFTQSQKMQAVGQLAGGVAHDFNNLLTAIIGFCDLLLLRHKPGDPSFQDIMQIQQNSNRAANLVRQLLAFSRQQTMSAKVQDVTDILTEISHLIRRLIGANIELDVAHGDDLSFVKVDANQMEQVFVNMAVNARDAMEDGGTLSIRTHMTETKRATQRGEDSMPAGRWVQIDITDTGTGIPDDVMERIFEPFFTTKDVGQGTGLGLATVYGIIRQSNGYLHVNSKVGKGTTFSIYLPEAQEEDTGDIPLTEEEKKKEEPVKDLTGTAHIMLVEDEDAVRTFSKRALANKGYQVSDANGGEQARALLETLNDGDIDLLITDVIMPDVDGPVLAKEIRAKFPDIKIIFMSGYTEEKLKDELDDDRTWFLPKPFTLTQLAAKVKDVLDS